MNKLTPAQLDRVRRAPIAERLHQYVGGIQVQALIEHVNALEAGEFARAFLAEPRRRLAESERKQR